MDSDGVRTPTATGEARRKRILVMTRWFDFPVNSGRRIRTWNFIEALKDRYELFCLNLTPAGEDDHPRDHPFVEFFNVPWCLHEDHRVPSPAKRLRDTARSIPIAVDSQYQEKYQEKFEEIVRGKTVDAILIRYIYQLQYVLRAGVEIDAKIVLDLDDIETLKIQREQALHTSRTLPRRFKDWLNLSVLKRYHARYLPRVDACCVCSERDRIHVEQNRWCDDVWVVPNTVQPVSTEVSVTRGSKVLLFIGTMDYEPNVEAVRWFCDSVLPRLLREDPEVRLHIVGAEPTPEVRALHDGKTIHVLGFVESVLPAYEEAAAMVVPIRIAGGTRIKILEAGLLKTPVISTSMGAEGLNVRSGEHCLIADDADAMVEACLRLLRDPDLQYGLAEGLEAFVREHYDATRVRERILQQFDALWAR